MDSNENARKLWHHETRQAGHVIISHITESYIDESEDVEDLIPGGRDIGWHVQDSVNKVVFFVPSGSCTYDEAETYRNSLARAGFKAKIVRPKGFHKFLEDMKNDLDPVFYVAASSQVPTA